MDARVYINVRVCVCVSEDEMRDAFSEDIANDYDGNVAMAATNVARERVARVIDDEISESFVIDVEEVKVNNSCVACNENDAYNAELGGVHLCPSCVMRALSFTRVMEYVNNVGDYDVPLARALSALGDEDVRMSRGGIAYVDSHSAAMDEFTSLSHDDVRDRLEVHVFRPMIDAITS